LDANKQILADTLSVDSLFTPNGKDLSVFIAKAQKKLGLEEEVGCAPRTYYINRTIDSEDSIWGLYRDKVVPEMFFTHEDTEDLNSIMFISKECWRYDLLSTSNLIVDDIWAIAPFNDTVTYMGSFEGSTILMLNMSMNENNDPWLELLPNYIMIGDIAETEGKEYKLYTHEYNAVHVKTALNEIVPDKKIEPERTEYSSTYIWLYFVQENWACDGMLGNLPNWVPTPDHVKNLRDGEGDEMQRAVAIFLIVFFLMVVLVCCICCWIWLRYICFGHHPVDQDELDALKMDDDELQNETEEVSLDNEDHEML
jgi:hypothetical protein